MHGQIFYFRSQEECAKWLHVDVPIVKDAIEGGFVVKGWFIDLTLD